MTYYLLTVWKRSGEKSNSLCCYSSTNFDDSLYNMTLCKIKEDEMYVIDMYKNGNENYQGGNVVASWYYDYKRKQIIEED